MFMDVLPQALRSPRIMLLLRGGVSAHNVPTKERTCPDVIQEVYVHHVSDDRLQAQANRRFGT